MNETPLSIAQNETFQPWCKMAIENFTKEEFEAALPSDKNGNKLWAHAGICPRSRQHTYTVTPFAGIPFAILVWSSLQTDGASSKEAGEDSIRAVITMDGKPWGGKAKRWVPRTTNWRTMMLDMLRALARQINFLKAPCPSCNGPLKPFTCKKVGPNKGRQFVCCKNEDCEKPAWRWCDEEPPANHTNQPNAAPAVDPQAPPCPICQAPMRRNSKGYSCTKGTRRNEGGTWITLGCKGVVWDSAKK